MRGDPHHEDRQQREQGRSMTTQRGTGQDWTGYVQPYRYYGPGYRGVGYYAVFYQGDPDEQPMGQDETRQFDQRNVHYGQGQGAGAAWSGRGSGSGQFAGRGPKGYRRSDERIREDVSDRLMENPDIDASQVEVNVSDGVVKLTGTVDDRWSKRFAEDLTETVSGVTDVMNQLTVESGYGQRDTGQRDTGPTPARDTSEATTSKGQPNGRRPATTSSR